MIVRDAGRTYEPCPEFTGQAALVDITPPRRTQTTYGERETFRLVFELDLPRPDGSRRCVSSQRFTASLHEKSSLRRFLRQWLGRDLQPSELVGFDLETLLGRPAHLVVVHATGDQGQTFDRIASCSPPQPDSNFVPSGRYVRVKDRPKREAFEEQLAHSTAATSPTQTEPASQAFTQAVAAEIARHAAVVVHVGRHQGKPFDELSDADIEALARHWLPSISQQVTTTEADQALAAAIQFVLRQRAPNPDDVPF